MATIHIGKAEVKYTLTKKVDGKETRQQIRPFEFNAGEVTTTDWALRVAICNIIMEYGLGPFWN